MSHKFLCIFFMLLFIACDKEGKIIIPEIPDPDPDPDGLPRVDKSITREDTYYNLELKDTAAWVFTQDSLIIKVDTSFTDNEINTIGKNIDTNWDESLGIITLSPDPEGTSPFPTINMEYDPMFFKKDPSFLFSVVSPSIQLYDVLEGTAAELNGRAYRFSLNDIGITIINDAPRIEVDEVGNNYIKGTLQGPVFKPIYKQNVWTGEIVVAGITLKFQACTRC